MPRTRPPRRPLTSSGRGSIPPPMLGMFEAPIEISSDSETPHHSSSQGQESSLDDSFPQWNPIATTQYPPSGFEAESSSRPRIVRRSVSAVRDFPPGCGPSAVRPPGRPPVSPPMSPFMPPSVPPPMPSPVPPPMPSPVLPQIPSPTYPSGIRSPIPYHVHQAVDRTFIREHSPTLAAHLDQIPIGPYQGVRVPSPDIQARVRALTQAAIARAR
ncbi:non-classical arabinogalactan protein 31-like [Daucus carota subsp. sativus]|uniref:non-classical arabinogalactan protein 31-like n=1 Tax=Daucus carota subsp. sativus TaxID=79200 RepID=UPI003083A27D